MQELIRQKIIDSLAASPPSLTRRDTRIPQVPGKAVAVIGPRRAGKTTFLWQVLAERLAATTPRERLLCWRQWTSIRGRHSTLLRWRPMPSAACRKR